MTDQSKFPTGNRAFIVALGILASRVLGLVRWSIMARYFGSGAHADVLRAAFQAPNALQNLLGEGTMSAAFIPVYSKMLEEGRPEAAGRFAGSILGLLTAVVCTGVVIGIWLAHPICSILMRGFVGDAAEVAAGIREVDRLLLAVDMIRLAFPMAGILVLSSWALGVLNSHRRFLMPYFAPVLWNVTIISVLLGVGSHAGYFPGDIKGTMLPETLTRLLTAVFVGGIFGGLLQFVIQLPSVFLVIKGFRLSFSTQADGVRQSLAAVGPALAGRGVAQLSAYLDILLATLLIEGAVASIGYAQVLYILPISLFGLSVAAAELPELTRIGMSSLPQMAERIRSGLRQGLFLAIPTALGYIVLGYTIIGAIYRGGLFGVDDNWLAYIILAAYSFGLLATVSSRLLQNGFWAQGDTRTPARMAGVRAFIAIIVAIPAMFVLDQVPVFFIPGVEVSRLYFGAVGLAIGSTVAAWVEWWFLVRILKRRLGGALIPWRTVGKMTSLGVIALIPSSVLWVVAQNWSPIVIGVIVTSVFAGTYLILAKIRGYPELMDWIGRWR
ncbi:MAG: murein biosynthesis integral membrane protein MurJ [Bacteroidetes bacterium]|nr:murein biosynthesis integral membrane protein MurJ [Bacteroidota bacterium]MCY4205609.1 murein biosynthesis integral membrane protein MurJ [Bacteroidota bacterium]